MFDVRTRAAQYAERMTEPDPLAEVRSQIDAIDRRIVALLAERQQWVLRAGSLKTDEAAVRAPARVEQVIAKVRLLASEAGASPEVIESAYRALISAYISLELDAHRGAASRSENPELLLQRALSAADQGDAVVATSELSQLLEITSDLPLRLRSAAALGELLIAAARAAEAEIVLAAAVTAADGADELDDVDKAELERVIELLNRVR